MNKIKLSLITILITPLMSCSYAVFVESDVLLVIQHANNDQRQAIKQQVAWNTVEPLLKAAEQAYQQGDKSHAMVLAQRAGQQARMSLEQADYERNHWQARVPH